MIMVVPTEGDISVVLIEKPWARVKNPPQIPQEETLTGELAAMSDLQFAQLIQSHLVPRENEVGGRQRWVALWETIVGTEELAAWTFDVLEELLDTTESALASGSLDDAAAARARKFRRVCTESWKRVQNVADDSTPLGWAGRAASGFNPVSRRVIAVLVGAIDKHRQGVLGAELEPTDEDRRLWAVLGQVSLDPQRSRRRK